MKRAGQILRSAGLIGGATLFSRVFGLIRDMVMTHAFGAGVVAEAFYVAFMIPNLLRRLVGEGSLTVAFISVFTKLRSEGGEEEARLFVRSFWTLMTVVLAVLTLIGMALSRFIVTLFTNPAFRAEPEKFELAVTLTRQMFPYLFLIGLVALSMGILNSYKRFFASSFHPVLLNFAWIAAVLILRGRLKDPGLILVIGVLAGGLLQLALQFPFLWKEGISVLPRFNLGHPAIWRVGKLMIPSTFAVGIVQINTMIATYFVTAFDGGRSHLFYSSRLTEFPYAIFSLAIATAVLPVLSEHAGKKDVGALMDVLVYGLRLTAIVTVPASIGLALVGRPLIHVIFEHGEFTAADTGGTSIMLAMACIGLWAVAGHRLVVQAYYAVEDMKTPLWSAALAMAINAACCFAFNRFTGLGEAGVPLALSLATMANFFALWFLLPAKVGKIDGKALIKTTALSILASLPMAALVWMANGLDMWDRPDMRAVKTAALGLEVMAGAVLFVIMARLLGLGEVNDIVDAAARRFGLKKKQVIQASEDKDNEG